MSFSKVWCAVCCLPVEHRYTDPEDLDQWAKCHGSRTRVVFWQGAIGVAFQEEADSIEYWLAQQAEVPLEYEGIL